MEITKEQILWLNNAYETSTESCAKVLSIIKEDASRVKDLSGRLWHDNQFFALCALFLKENIVACKQFFYNCGRLDEYLIKNFDSRLLEYGISHIAYALLSDNHDLIKRYACLAPKGYDKITKKGSIIYAMQLAIRDELHQDYIDVLDKLSQKKGQTAIQPDVQFFKSLIDRDKSGCEAAINELLTPRQHKQRNKNIELVNEFISHPAIGYSKLAWFKGVNVEIDNPLVPKLLLPINPNEQYSSEYEFLKELEHE